MDNVFGIGLPELILILVIAGMVMGPERIARTARSLGSLTARLQTISRSFLRQLNAELDSVDESGQLKSTVEELDQLRRQVTELRNEVFTLASGATLDGRKAIHTLKREVENSILPPDSDAAVRATPHHHANGQDDGTESKVRLDADQPASPTVTSSSNQAIGRAVELPKRVNVAEDPDE